jgi:hypothetical protein
MLWTVGNERERDVSLYFPVLYACLVAVSRATEETVFAIGMLYVPASHVLHAFRDQERAGEGPTDREIGRPPASGKSPA